MLSSSRNRLAALALAATLAACSDAPSGPNTSSAPDVAALLAEMSAPSIAAARGLAGGDVGIEVTRVGTSADAGCTYSASSGYFECPAVGTPDLRFTRMFKLMDADGNAQSHPDSHTAAIELKTTIDGSFSTTMGGAAPSASTTQMHGVSVDTLSGVGTDTHVLHGGSTMTVKGSVQTGSTVFPIDDTQKVRIANVVLPNAKKGQKWPQSGSIIIDESSNPTDPVLGYSSHVVITFDGTSVVTMTLTSDFASYSCRFDLASPLGSGSCVP